MAGNYGNISYEEPNPEEFVKEEFMVYDYYGSEGNISSNQHVNAVDQLVVKKELEGELTAFKTKDKEEDCEVKPVNAVFLKEDDDVGFSESNDFDPLTVNEEDRVKNAVGFEIKTSPLSPTSSDTADTELFIQPIHKPKNNKKKTSTATMDSKVDEAYDFMKQAADALNRKDESSIFGEMVAAKIRKLTPRNQAIAENKISNFLFKLEMEEMKDPSYPHLSPQSPLSPAMSVSSLGSSSSTLASPAPQPLVLFVSQENINQTQNYSENTVDDYNALFQSIHEENNVRTDDTYDL